MAELSKGSISKYPLISQRFLSYLEKHRIFELFQELSMMLLIKKPEDHVLFLKQSIYHAARRLDAPRIIILAPPGFDKLRLAKELKAKLKVPLITLSDIAGDAESILDSSFIVENLRIILMNQMKMNCDGWIFLDFPRTEKEAQCLQREGMVPSHVIEIVSYSTMCNSITPSENSSKSHYDREIQGLRHVFKKLIMTINSESRKIEDITEECLNLVKRRKYSRAPTALRVLLIDSLDYVRCHGLSQHLAQIFNIIHIDFNEVIERICLQDTELGSNLRKARRKTKFSDLQSTLKIQAFEQFLLQSESLKRGWVLTGFASTVDDFKYLDMTVTPPNRVIIIVPEKHECCNVTNSHTDGKNISENICSNSNTELVYISEENMNEIINYAGESAIFIEEHEDLKVVKERVAFNLMQPPPCVPPRQPRPASVIKPEDIEFDPDDEPSTEIFDQIREPEPMLPLV